ncbi:unnamed protein product [Adineta ricciae]|uniref:Uncharacterized protein n=1 Tax=Adineta ricciae TaxID=249248 RepID=A0A814EJY8_ADIRI|nr:unnamed protein product [Adineta ricciae]
MAAESELDRNAIFEKFASIKRMHDEIGRQQTEDFRKRLEKSKEDENNFMCKLISQQVPSRPQQDNSGRAQNSARRDLFLTSKNDTNQSHISQLQQNHHQQQQYQTYKAPSRSQHHDPYENGDHDWNIDDDIQPLNITDNDGFDERLPNRLTNDDDIEDAYLTAYHQLLQTHQQQHQMMAQQEQENMLSTILEASCEDATPMTSLVDVHQQRLQLSPTRRTPVAEVHYKNEEEDVEEEEEEEEENDDDGELTDRPKAPSFASIDDIPVSTAFSKNESLKYSEYIHQKLQTEVNNHS